MTVKLLAEHHLESLSLKGGCTGLSELKLVKLPHCWKSHIAVHLSLTKETIFVSINPFNSYGLSHIHWPLSL